MRNRERRAQPSSRIPAMVAEGWRAFAAAVIRDLEYRRGFLWWPVAFGIGAALFFMLPFEPQTWQIFGPVCAVLLALAGIRIRTGALAFPLMLLVLMALGMAAAEISTLRAETPRLPAQRTVTITGVVEAVEDRESRGYRILIRPTAIDPAPKVGLPKRVRIAVRGLTGAPVPGSGIKLLARIGPPQPPLIPGGYDFARTAYFQEIGGVGFSLGKPEILPAPTDLSAEFTALAAVERFRQAVSTRIREVLPGETGAIAAALIVGDRGAIDPDTDEAMRISGLSHILSISGLHMAMVAACLFGGLRYGLALVPIIALTWPVKKLAAGAAMAGTFAYMVISGLSVPAERSAIMIGVALAAILVDRQALSLRVVAVAALLILAIEPEAVLDPGAQMSFAAVTALIAGYEALGARRKPPPDAGDINPAIRAGGVALRWIGASLLTSLIAGLATGPIALHHFNRFAPLGLVANLLATPLVSFVVMPSALVSALAMPAGLEVWPLKLMGWGIDLMIVIAEEVAAWTPGGGTLGRPALAGTLLLVAGGLWVCLWTGAARSPGYLVIAAGLILSPFATRPGLIVSGDGDRALLVDRTGALLVLGRASGFETELWLAALGDPRIPRDSSLVAGTACDKEACVALEGEGRVIAALVRQPVAFGDECGRATLVITPLDAPRWCSERSVVLDRTDLEASGARSFQLDWTGEKPRLTPIGEAIPASRRIWHGG